MGKVWFQTAWDLRQSSHSLSMTKVGKSGLKMRVAKIKIHFNVDTSRKYFWSVQVISDLSPECVIFEFLTRRNLYKLSILANRCLSHRKAIAEMSVGSDKSLKSVTCRVKLLSRLITAIKWTPKCVELIVKFSTRLICWCNQTFKTRRCWRRWKALWGPPHATNPLSSPFESLSQIVHLGNFQNKKENLSKWI